MAVTSRPRQRHERRLSRSGCSRRSAAANRWPRRRCATARAAENAGHSRALRADPVASVTVKSLRRCSRTACAQPAVWTLTYVYADSMVVLGPLATYAEPHCYDLCADHANRLTAPLGWEVLRLVADQESTGPSEDDLCALADAVREAAKPPPSTGAIEIGRRGHLRMLRDDSRTD